MAIRSDLTIDWSVSTRLIQVSKNGVESTQLTIQDLYDTVRSLACSSGAIDETEIIDGSGKEILSATEKVGLTVKLLNAKVKFEDRAAPIDCVIYGGNLVAETATGGSMNPIQYATFVTVSYAKSISASIAEGATPEDIDTQLSATHGASLWIKKRGIFK